MSSSWKSGKKSVEAKKVKNPPVFEPIGKVVKRHGWKIGVWGPEGSGKSHFLMSMPPPIFVIDTEFGVAQLQKHFPDKDIRIADCWVVHDDSADFLTDPVESLENVDLAVESLIKEVKEGTIAIDSGSDLWRWITGKLREVVLKVDPHASVQPSDYAWANAKYSSIMLRLLKAPAHFCITGKSSPVYTSASLETTGETKPTWQKDTGYLMDFVLKLQIIKKERYAIIEKCRYDKEIGKMIKGPTWDKLYEIYKEIVPT
jgi:hypothetical protein